MLKIFFSRSAILFFVVFAQLTYSVNLNAAVLSSAGIMKAVAQLNRDAANPENQTDIRLALVSISEVIEVLPNNEFNNVILGLGDLYSREPNNRGIYTELMSVISFRIKSELDSDKNYNRVESFVDHSLLAYFLFQAGFMAKGFRSQDLKDLGQIERWSARWKNAKAAKISDPVSRAKAIAAATGIGGAFALHQHLSTKKINPFKVLNSVQSVCISELAVRVRDLKDQITNWVKADVTLKLSRAELDQEISKMSLALERFKSELEHFKKASMYYIGDFSYLSESIKPIAHDLDHASDIFFNFKETSRSK